MNEAQPSFPEGHEAYELSDVSVEDQLSSVVDHLARASMVDDKQVQQEAVSHAMGVLDVENLREEVLDKQSDTTEIIFNFDLVEAVLELRKVDEEAAEEVLYDFAIAPQHCDDQNFTNRLIEVAAEMLAGRPLSEVPRYKAEIFRGEARAKVYRYRSETYENSRVDEPVQ